MPIKTKYFFLDPNWLTFILRLFPGIRFLVLLLFKTTPIFCSPQYLSSPTFFPFKRVLRWHVRVHFYYFRIHSNSVVEINFKPMMLPCLHIPSLPRSLTFLEERTFIYNVPLFFLSFLNGPRVLLTFLLFFPFLVIQFRG